ASARLALTFLLLVSPLTGFAPAGHRTVRLASPRARAKPPCRANRRLLRGTPHTRSDDLRRLARLSGRARRAPVAPAFLCSLRGPSHSKNLADLHRRPGN